MLTAQATVTIDFHDPAVPAPGVFLAFKLIFFAQLARLATRSPVQPLRVGWPSPPAREADALLYQDFFGSPVTSAPQATLVFSAEDLERPFLTENHRMWQFFEPSLRQRLADLDRTAGMAERMRSTLLEALPAGEVSMQAFHSHGPSWRGLARPRRRCARKCARRRPSVPPFTGRHQVPAATAGRRRQ
jgi:hypothetical protein